MAAFDPDDTADQRAYRLVLNTSVVMFWRERVLAETVSWLRADGYRVVEVGAGAAGLLADLARALDFPAYFGGGLDAFDDCLRDVVAGEDAGGAAGLVLVLRRYDAVAREDHDLAFRVLDIIARQCRDAALIGRRFVCMVQSDDPGLRFAPVGATPVLWNDAEWLDSARDG